MKKKRQIRKIAKLKIDSSKNKFETIVRIISPMFLLLAIILISKKNITGNAINNLNFTGTTPIVVILIIALIFVVVAGIKREI